MYFEVIDNKFDCFGYFIDGNINLIPPSVEEQHFCWTYNEQLKDYNNIEYVSLYCNGKDINELCPEHLKQDWALLCERFKAFFRAFYIAKINLEDNCFYDMIPMTFLVEYFTVKTKIIEYIAKNYPRPSNYEHLFEVMKVCNKIRSQKLNIDTSCLNIRIADPMVKKAKIKYDNLAPYIKYDVFGTKTGRLSTIANSFPILQMDKEYRSIIEPTNDWFLELDYNGAELRTFLSLAGEEQPEVDIHDWNIQHIYDNKVNRDEAKEKIFAWLYSDNKNAKAEQIYKKEEVRKKYWDGTKVTTYWGREIEADKHHSLSYIVQSTFADLVLKQMVKVFKFLEGKKSFIAFSVHDNIVIDLHDDEKYLLPQLVKMFSDTELGNFLVNTKVGANYGSLKTIKIK
jgi:hypothetical protein